MLQQTRVDTVIAYYQRWMTRFPDIRSLALADQEEALKLWEGLGYYTRARKIHEAAREIMEKFDGDFPSDPEVFVTLPGIGAYTSAAIASFAFDQDTFPVDGNINRVFARVFRINEVLGSKKFAAEIEKYRGEIFPIGRSADFNQALMDLGAMICTPSAPNCAQCPLSADCKGRVTAADYPLKAAKKAVPIKQKIALVVELDGSVLIKKRPDQGLLGGMWEFPCAELEGDLNNMYAENAIHDLFGVDPVGIEHLVTVKHAYTHFKVVERAYVLKIKTPSKVNIEGVWFEIDKLSDIPMGKIDRSIATKLLKR